MSDENGISKQLASSLRNPDRESGGKFSQQTVADEMYPVSSIDKILIKPQSAEIFEIKPEGFIRETKPGAHYKADYHVVEADIKSTSSKIIIPERKNKKIISQYLSNSIRLTVSSLTENSNIGSTIKMLKNVAGFYVFGIILPVVASLFLIGVPLVLLFDIIPSEFVLNHGLKIFGSESELESVHIGSEIVDLGALFEKRYLQSGKSFEQAREVQGWVWNNRPSVFAGILLYALWSLGVVAASIWAFLHAQAGYKYKKEEWCYCNKRNKKGFKDKFTAASYKNYLNDMESHSLDEFKYKNLCINTESSPDSYIGLSSIMNFSGNLIAQYKVNEYIDAIKEALKKEGLYYMFSFQSSRNFYITLREFNLPIKSNPPPVIKKIKELEKTYTKAGKPGVLSGRVNGICLDKLLGFFVKFDETNFTKYSGVSSKCSPYVNGNKQLFARVNFASLIDYKNEKDLNRAIEVLKCFDNKTIGTAYFDKIEVVSFSNIYNYATLLSKDLKNGELNYFNENYQKVLNHSRMCNDRPIFTSPCVS